MPHPITDALANVTNAGFFNVDSVTTLQRVVLSLKIVRV